MPQTKKITEPLYLFVLSHPIQYFAPLYQEFVKQNHRVEVLYFTDVTVKQEATVDDGFGVPVKWDIPLLEGYNYKFLPNYGIGKPLTGSLSLMNWGLIKHFFKYKKQYKNVFLTIHGWFFCSNVLAAFVGRLLGFHLILRTENPLCLESDKNSFKQGFKKLFLRHFYFPMFKTILFMGDENKAFLKKYKVPDKKLHFAPYAVDNTRLNNAFILLKPERTNLRARFKIPEHTMVVLFVGKYTHKKRVMTLLEAFKQVNNNSSMLIMVGEGNERPNMEAYIAQNQLNVVLTGFKNQTELPEYYSIADVFVLPSAEQWGLVTNEAMNFGLPVIISDQVGCHKNLVKQNGCVFECDNVNDLAKALKTLLGNADYRYSAGQTSLELIKQYSFGNTVSAIVNATQLN